MARETIAGVRTERDALQAENERLRKDLELIGRSIKAEAVSHGWCGDYERVVERINSKLLVPMPASRYISSRTYDIGVTMTISGIPTGWQVHNFPADGHVAQCLGTYLNRQSTRLRTQLEVPIGDYIGFSAQPIDLEPEP